MTSSDARRAALPRGLAVLLTLAASVVIIAGLRAFGGVLGPVLLALVLVITVHPIYSWLRGRGVPGWLAMTAMLVAVFAIVLGIAVALVLSLAQLAAVLPSYQPRFAALVTQVTDALAAAGIGPDQVRSLLSGVDVGTVAGLVTSLLGGIASTLSDLVFLLSLLLFMGLDAAGFPERMTVISAERPRFVEAFTTFTRGTRSYLAVTTVFGLIVAALDGVALWVMGIPLVLLWVLVSFVTNYVPNVGFVIGLAPPALLGLLEGGPRLAVLVIVVYSVINFVIQSLIQPKYIGDAVDLSLTVTFLSLVFWAWVIGALGAILAIPLTLLVKTLLIDADPAHAWMAPLLTSSRPAAREGEERDEPDRDARPPPVP